MRLASHAINTLLAALLLLVSCQEYRIEYRKRPSYYKQAAVGELPDQITLDDGTTIIYEELKSSELEKRGRDESSFKVWEEDKEGNITIRALLPEHVLGAISQALTTERYDLLYQQLVSDLTKQEMERRDEGEEQFVEFCRTNRKELATTINRMMLGIPRQEVVVENKPGGIIRCRIRPQYAKDFKFKDVDMVSEGEGLKLLIIR